MMDDGLTYLCCRAIAPDTSQVLQVLPQVNRNANVPALRLHSFLLCIHYRSILRTSQVANKRKPPVLLTGPGGGSRLLPSVSAALQLLVRVHHGARHHVYHVLRPVVGAEVGQALTGGRGEA